MTIKKQKSPFNLVPNAMILDDKISATAFKLWSILSLKSDGSVVSFEEIAKDFQIEERSKIKEAKEELIKSGYLKVEETEEGIIYNLSY